jgi:7-cyano-7-deazaguanine synthase
VYKRQIINIDKSLFEGSQCPIVKHNKTFQSGSLVSKTKIPDTYVPCRNLLLLSHAISCAESICSQDVFFGANIVDYGNYPDCRPDFINAVENSATLSSKECNERGVRFRIHTPIIQMNKAQIIRLGIEMNIDYSKTISCYNPSKEGLSCGKCLSCSIRKRGFADAGIEDPTTYCDTSN